LKQFIRHASVAAGSTLFTAARAALGKSQQYILVLSQLRSGSTLFHHLLQTNPAVLGIGESGRTYSTPLDLKRLSLRAHLNHGRTGRWASYVTDQINHTSYLHTRSLLMLPNVHAIFLIREPRGVIGSLLQQSSMKHYWTVQRAAEYYLERTSSIGELIRNLGDTQPRRAFGLTYNMLTENTSPTLAALQRHLALLEPFLTTYRLHYHTGLRGDPSERIKAGTVLKPVSHAELNLDASLERELLEHYECTLTALLRHCSTPETAGG
jgi:hypothetical protein